MTPEVIALPTLRVDFGQEWKDQAACKGVAVDHFFPEDDSAINRFTAAKALAVCLGCPVRFTCLQFAVENCIGHGIYGGHTAQTRKSFRTKGYSEKSSLFTLPRALHILKNALIEDPLQELARIKGITVEEVLEEGKDGNRHWI